MSELVLGTLLAPPLWLEVVVKATLLLALAAAASALLRGALPATRHALWAGALATVLVLPAAVALVPPWRVALLPTGWSAPGLSRDGHADGTGAELPIDALDEGTWAEAAGPGAQASSAGEPGSVPGGARPVATGEAAADGVPVAPAAAGRASPAGRVLGGVWLAGLLACLAWLLGGVVGLHRVARRAVPLEGHEWRRLLTEEAELAGVRRPVRLLRSAAASAPVTWGLGRPVVLLPDAAGTWTEARRRVVLRHELAHVARRDPLTQLLAGLACALYWFHPTVWWAARRLRSERELACDDRVLAAGVGGPEYARHLLEVARAARTPRGSALVSVAMARPSELEGRLLAVLDEGRRREPERGRTGAWRPAAAGLAVVLAVAAFSPVARGDDAAVTGPAGGSDSGPAPGVPSAGAAPPILSAEPACDASTSLHSQAEETMIDCPAAARVSCAATAVALLLAPCAAPVDAQQPPFEQDRPLGRQLVEVVRVDRESTGVEIRDIRGVGTDARGRIWVAEWNVFVHVFDARGAHVTSWDLRSGDATGISPAELERYWALDVRERRQPGDVVTSISALDVDATRDLLAVRHGWSGSGGARGPEQITILSTDMERLARWPVPLFGRGTAAGVRFDPEGPGLMFPVGQRRDSVMDGDRGMVWSESLLLRASEDGDVQETVTELAGAWLRRHPEGAVTTATAGNALWLPLPSHGLLVGDGQRTYRYAVLSRDGQVLRTVGRNMEHEVLIGRDGSEWPRGFVRRVAFDPFRQEILACRTQPEGRGPLDPVTVDHFAVTGEYLGTAVWPSCPRHVGADGTVFVDIAGSTFRDGVVSGFRYAGEP